MYIVLFIFMLFLFLFICVQIKHEILSQKLSVAQRTENVLPMKHEILGLEIQT